MANISVTNGTRVGEVTCAPGCTVFEALAETDWLPRADCGGRGVCGLCRIRVADSAVLPPTTLEQARLPAAALAAGVRLACQARPAGDLTVTVEPLQPAGAAWPPVSDLPALCWPEGAGGDGLGVAIDLGSTNIRVSLLELGTGRRLAARYGQNPQARYGADVLTRLDRAGASPPAARWMALATRIAITEGLAALFDRELAGQYSRDAVRRLGIVGNTAVLALLTGQGYRDLLDPANWGRPIACTAGDVVRWRYGWGLDEDTAIQVWAPLAGFVGSDLLAGVAACDLLAGPAPAMLVDFGTNTEIALWDGATLWVAAAAGGPAFEGCGISCGLPAEAGAIHRVMWPDGVPAPEVSVLGGGPALGLCGSGLVDAVAGLRRAGLLAPSGRMASAVPRTGWPLGAGPAAPRLTRSDIDVFQRAKAAVAAGMQYLLRQAGVGVDALATVHVSGIFGRHLDPVSAQAVGLLPPGPPERLVCARDRALCGCERLLGADGAEVLQDIRRVAHHVNLALAPGYEDLFIDNLRLTPMRA